MKELSLRVEFRKCHSEPYPKGEESSNYSNVLDRGFQFEDPSLRSLDIRRDPSGG